MVIKRDLLIVDTFDSESSLTRDLHPEGAANRLLKGPRFTLWTELEIIIIKMIFSDS